MSATDFDSLTPTENRVTQIEKRLARIEGKLNFGLSIIIALSPLNLIKLYWPAWNAATEAAAVSQATATAGRAAATATGAEPPAMPVTTTMIRQIELQLYKAEHGMGMPYDAERVAQLRRMLREARKRKLSELLAAKRRAASRFG